LDQVAVRVEQQLRVIECAAVTFVDANGHHHFGLPRGLADGLRGGRGHGYGLIEQPEELAELQNFLNDSLQGSFPAVEHGANLYCCRFDDNHAVLLW
jgi:hypothetical protein